MGPSGTLLTETYTYRPNTFQMARTNSKNYKHYVAKITGSSKQLVDLVTDIHNQTNMSIDKSKKENKFPVNQSL